MNKKTLFTAFEDVIHVMPNAMQHLEAHPTVIPLLEEAAGKLALPSDANFFKGEINMGRVIGHSECVKTATINDLMSTDFAVRPGRKLASRVAIDVEKPESNTLSIIAFRHRDYEWRLITAYIGPLAPREPHDPRIEDPSERQACLTFWCSHALVHDSSWGKPFVASWRQIMHNSHCA